LRLLNYFQEFFYMIRINLEVNDPTRSDGPKLLALAALFTQLAQGSTADQARAQLEEKTTSGRVVGAPAALAAPYTGPALDKADNPATGMPTPAEAFAPGGYVESADTATGAVSREELDQAVADATLPDPAAVFGGGAPNVPPPAAAPGASSVTTNGTPPAPNSGAQTAGANIPASAPGVDVDSEGVPWDASIHASSKTKIANGTWKVKRGTPELYLKERKEQLKAALAVGQAAATGNGAAGASATPPAIVPPPASAAGAGAPIPPPPSSAGNAPAPIPTPQASAQTTQGAAASNTVTLAQLLPRVTAAIGAGTLTADTAAAIVRELSDNKIDSVAMLAVAPALIPAFVARLDALGIPA
jgi:hypothetical protein